MTINAIPLVERSNIRTFNPESSNLTSDTLSTASSGSDFTTSALEELDARLTLALQKSGRALSEARNLLDSARQPFHIELSTSERLMLYRAAQPKVSFSRETWLEETHIPGIHRIRTGPHARAGAGEVNEQRHIPYDRRGFLPRARLSSSRLDEFNTSSPQPPIHPKALHIHIWLSTLPDDPVLAMHLPASMPDHRQGDCGTFDEDDEDDEVVDHLSPPPDTSPERLFDDEPAQPTLGKRSFGEIFDEWEVRRDPSGPKLGKLKKGESPEGEMIEYLFGMRRG